MLHNDQIKLEKRYYLMLGVLLLGSLGVAATGIASSMVEARLDIAAVIRHRSKTYETPVAFKDINLAARSAYAKDLRSGRVLYRLNENKPLPLASLTKVMTALVAEEVLGANALIELGDAELIPEGDSGLAAGDRWSVGPLRDLMLIASSNDAAQALAVATLLSSGRLETRSDVSSFVAHMNDRALELGLEQTTYRNPTGLDVSPSRSGARGSARDMAELFAYVHAAHPDVFKKTVLPTANLYDADGGMLRVKNTDTALGAIPDVVASKTGYTDLAGGNLGIIFNVNPDQPVVIVVLGSTAEGRFSDVKKIVAATIKTLKK